MEAITGNTFYFDFEVRLMEILQSVLGERGVFFISQFSAFGEILVMVLVFGLFYWGFDKKTGIRMGTGLMLALCLNPMIKNIAFRRRPYFDNPTIKCLRPVEKGADIYDIAAQGFSFPSAHATDSVAVYSGIGLFRKEKWLKVVGVVLPIFVGISRVAVGVHYPTDILVGWLIGILVLLVVPKALDKAGDEKRWIVFAAITVFGIIGAFYCKTDDFFSGFGIMGGFLWGVEMEERFIKFEDAKKPLEMVGRVVLGIALFAGLNAVLKVITPAAILERGDVVSQLFRSLRYCVTSFVAVGLYPFCFERFSKIFDK